MEGIVSFAQVKESSASAEEFNFQVEVCVDILAFRVVSFSEEKQGFVYF